MQDRVPVLLLVMCKSDGVGPAHNCELWARIRVKVGFDRFIGLPHNCDSYFVA